MRSHLPFASREVSKMLFIGVKMCMAVDAVAVQSLGEVEAFAPGPIGASHKLQCELHFECFMSCVLYVL